MPLNRISKYRGEIFGVAIISIILFHYSDDYMAAVWDKKIDPGQHPFFHIPVYYYFRIVGSIGVETFLFLSGVGLYYSYSADLSAKEFYKRRLMRILPTYLIVGGIFWVVKDMVLLREGIAEVAKDLFFVSMVTDGVITIWFVGLILFLYLIYPVIYACLFDPETMKGRLMSLAFLLVLFSAIPLLISIYTPGLYDNIQIAITRIPVFIIGCWAGKAVAEKKTIPKAVVLTIILGGILSQWFFITFFDVAYDTVLARYMDTILSFAVLAILVLLFHVLRNITWIGKAMRVVGSYSLELYVTHITLRNLLKTVGVHTYNPFIYFAMIVCAAVLSVLLKAITGCIHRRFVS